MLIIIDRKIPEPAKRDLRKYGDLLELHTSGITYKAISGHPDIFFCRLQEEFIVAPNTPEQILEIFHINGINFRKGLTEVGARYPLSAIYNAVITDNYCIHNLDHTDPFILESAGDLTRIRVNQGYTRCNLLPLKNDHFITSDRGIYQVLRKNNLEVLLVDSTGIQLQEFKKGFFGGACGVYGNKVFMIGSLDHHHEGDSIRSFLENLQYEIIELYDGPLYDGGSILF